MSYKINDITFYFENNKVINNLSITLEKGKFFGIIGPNGCGKTTFLDLLLRHLSPATGSIAFMGKDLKKYSKKELSKKIALVPQNYYINFPFKVKEIVLMGRYPHISRFNSPSEKDYNIVNDVMQKTGTYKFKDQHITKLSGGERQRVVFARSLAQDTPVLILDEATSNLDINYTFNLLNIAKQSVIQSNKTIIAVFQDINLASFYCDYLIFMSQGNIVFHGTVDKVLTAHTIKSVFFVNSKVYYDSYSDSKHVVYKAK